MALQAGADAPGEAGLAQLARADVDRHDQPRPAPVPLDQRRAGLFQHPLVEFVDQPGFFRQRDEGSRLDVAALGMSPAQQRLDATDLAALQRQLRLVFQVQLVAREGLAQLALQLQAPVDRRLHLRGEEVQRVAPAELGAVHRGVGLLQRIGGQLGTERMQGNADAGADRQFMAVHQTGFHQALEQLLADFGGVLSGHLRLFGERLKEHHEFVAAQPRQGVLGAQAGRQACGDFAQQGVADRVAEAVVDRLEVVEVDEQQRAEALLALLAVHRVLQPVEQQAPVRQAGQLVAVGQPLDLALVALALGNVGDAQAQQRLFAAGQAHQANLARAHATGTVADQPVEHRRFASQRRTQVDARSLAGRLAVGLLRRAEVHRQAAE